jgi:hypothetical protein
MFDKFASSSDVNSERAKHALTLAKVGLSVLLVLHIDIEGLTLEENL